MPVPMHNYTWGQGEDLVVSLIYKVIEAPTEANPSPVATAVDLTGYAVRMDIVDEAGMAMFTFNSEDVDTPLDTTGTADNEVTLGTDGTISITVPRALALPGGPVFDAVQAENNVFQYDIFLRDTTDKQKKILRGSITVEKSYTLWT